MDVAIYLNYEERVLVRRVLALLHLGRSLQKWRRHISKMHFAQYWGYADMKIHITLFDYHRAYKRRIRERRKS